MPFKLAKRVAPVSLYQNIDPTKCLRNHLGMVRSVAIGRCNWCSLTSAGPPLTNILDRRKTFIALASFRSFYEKTISGHFLDLLKENGLPSIWWEFRLNGFLEYKILKTLLFKIKIIDSPQCIFCKNEIEILEHVFYNCEITRSFWVALLSWFI